MKTNKPHSLPKNVPSFLRSESKSHEIRKGFVNGLPIILGYLPIAFAYGVLAADAHTPGWVAISFSVFIYAGASQFVAIGLLTSGVSALTIVVTTLIINARHLLMSAAMVPFLGHW